MVLKPETANLKQNNNHLKKALGVSFGIAIMVGGTIGVGILRTPGSIAALLDNYWLILSCWIAGGLYVLIGVGTFAELATMLPKAGGAYNYVKRAFGNYAGFITGWFDYLSNAIAPAFFCIVISEYVVILFPFLGEQNTVIALSFLMGFTLLHAAGIKTGSAVQQITSVLKVILFVILIVACFFYSGIEYNPVKEVPHVGEISVVVAFFKSLQLVMGTYDGWAGVSYFAEEDENPSRNIPRSLYIGAVVVIVIYLLVNIAFMQVLPIPEIANSPLAASAVSKIIFGARGSTVVTIIALFSIISILNAYMMIPSRIMFGLARDGFFFKSVTKINAGGTPITALIISSAFSFILICVGSFEILFSISAFFMVIAYGLAYISLVKLRISEPELPRPHRSWGYPFTSIIMIVFSIALFLGFALSDAVGLYAVIITTALSYPLFLVIKRNNI